MGDPDPQNERVQEDMLKLRLFLEAVGKEVKKYEDKLEVFGAFNVRTFLVKYINDEQIEERVHPYFLAAAGMLQDNIYDLISTMLQKERGYVIKQRSTLAEKYPNESDKKLALYYYADKNEKLLKKLIYEPLIKELHRYVYYYIYNQDKDITQAIVVDGLMPRLKAENSRLSVRDIFDLAFAKIYADWDGKQTAPPAANLPSSEEAPELIEKVILKATDTELKQDLDKTPGWFRKLISMVTGGHKMYAFTWWIFEKKEFEKVKNHHIYPRIRGDFQAGYDEYPNKEIQRVVFAKADFNESQTKEPGRVKGQYVGYMGFTPAGLLEGRRDGGKDGALVPQFDVKSDHVVALGVAHIKRFDLWRLKYNFLRKHQVDLSYLTWKWTSWKPTPSTAVLKERIVEKLEEDVKEVEKVSSNEGEHDLKWVTGKNFYAIKQILKDFYELYQSDPSHKENVYKEVFARLKGPAWRGFWLAYTIAWWYADQIKNDDALRTEIKRLMPYRWGINQTSISGWWSARKEKASYPFSTMTSDLKSLITVLKALKISTFKKKGD